MKSTWQILSAVVDGEISTRQQATALLNEETGDLALFLGISEDEARAKLLGNIAAIAGRYHSPKNRKLISDLFQLKLGDQ
jgi:hypothetical protein